MSMHERCSNCDNQTNNGTTYRNSLLCTSCYLEYVSDAVNSPSHYNTGNIECIDAIEAMLGREGFVAYCRGNALKYLWRCLYKGATDTDLQKAVWYIERARKCNE